MVDKEVQKYAIWSTQLIQFDTKYGSLWTYVS